MTTALGACDPEHCAAIHVTLAMGARPKLDGELSDAAERTLKHLQYYRDWDSGYSKQQATRPQTVGYGLVDSPAGQAAWILEKFWSWTDTRDSERGGHPEDVLTRDELLDNIMLYWINGNAASSGRLYWESFGKGPRHTVTFPLGLQCSLRRLLLPYGSGWRTATPTSCIGPSMLEAVILPRSRFPSTYVKEIRTMFRPFHQGAR